MTSKRDNVNESLILHWTRLGWTSFNIYYPQVATLLRLSILIVPDSIKHMKHVIIFTMPDGKLTM